MSQSVCSIRCSAKCEPTMPVMPVMKARGLAIAGSRSDQSAAAEEAAERLDDVVACAVVDRLVIAEREGVGHDPGCMRQIADRAVGIHLHRRLARDVAADDRTRLDVGLVEGIGQVLDREWRVLAYPHREAGPGALAPP